ncbi:DnaJ domain-containing protein [Marivirga sericea]|uniref:DnaJ domain-containing protein n=1 Tax=Marivirga sericea TaxID=1028 RepID=A0A1X7LE94_9BACT|nr:J domain-containing protein [Marivirga sericea]SMG52186.1 DnaJ domain-containing protein [Marivirga sericea]
MARIKKTYAEYISVLGLRLGASSEEIKEAYRKLAKQYHPDVYKLDDGERFKEISAAFSFLRKNPDPPVQNQARQRTRENEYERRRQAYHQRKQKKEAEEATRKAEMYKWLFARLRLFALVIVIFNFLLLIDYLLPSETEEVKVSGIETVNRYSSHSSGKANLAYSYKAILSNGMSFRFEKQGIAKIHRSDEFLLERSIIFQQAQSLSSKEDKVIFYSEYGIFNIFGFLIPVAIILIVGYFYFVKNNDYRLTMFLIAAVIFAVQLVLIF